MGERKENEAFITLATNNSYALGCLVLGNSLRKVNTTRQIVVMVTNGVKQSLRDRLGTVFDKIKDVNLLDSSASASCSLDLLGRKDLSVTFTKLHCWRQTEYKKCVFMDADTMVVQNIDDCFNRSELSAAPDAGWPDCFNSGVFVFEPSEQTYENLLSTALNLGSFDGADQGLLNQYFSNWSTEDINKHLPFTYNVVSQAFYSYLPAFKQFYNDIKVVHFIGAVKPWHHAYNRRTCTVSALPGSAHSEEFLQKWWSLLMECVPAHPHLDQTLSGITGDLSNLKISESDSSAGMSGRSDRIRKLQWEDGQVDYLGADRFENILAKLDTKIALPSTSSTCCKSSKPSKKTSRSDQVDKQPPEKY